MNSTQAEMDRVLSVKVRGEFGYELALEGLSYNFDQDPEKMPQVADRLCTKDHGENKFLRSIFMWLEVRAPKLWWTEADTYQVATTKQSQSTMHTIRRRQLMQADFNQNIPESFLQHINHLIHEGACVRTIKGVLPDSFVQKRMWVINYQTLREIIIQRQSHPLIEWQVFCDSVLGQIQHPELLPGDRPKMIERLRAFFGPDLCASDCTPTASPK